MINAKGSSAPASDLRSLDCGCRRGSPPRRPDRVHEKAAGPKVLSDEIAPALSINPGHVDRTLALDEADHLRHRIFRWDRKQHVHVIGHQMPLLNFRVLLKRELAEHFAQMPSQLLIQRLSPTFRDEDRLLTLELR